MRRAYPEAISARTWPSDNQFKARNHMVNRASGRRYQDSVRALLLPGITNVREDARPQAGDLIGAALAHCRRWGPLFLLILVANTFIATLAWTVIGLFLN